MLSIQCIPVDEEQREIRKQKRVQVIDDSELNENMSGTKMKKCTRGRGITWYNMTFPPSLTTPSTYYLSDYSLLAATFPCPS